MTEPVVWEQVNTRYGQLQAAWVMGYIKGLEAGGMTVRDAWNFASKTIHIQFVIGMGATEVKP